MKKTITKKKATKPTTAVDYPVLLGGVSELLESARRASARAANAFMTATYWEIGRRIVEFEQHGAKRAAYGEQLLKRLAADLTASHGRSFSVRNLENMRLFYGVCGPSQISQTLSEKLSSVSPVAPISETASEKSRKSAAIPFMVEPLGALPPDFPTRGGNDILRLELAVFGGMPLFRNRGIPTSETVVTTGPSIRTEWIIRVPLAIR
jgi:hypothetical protein